MNLRLIREPSLENARTLGSLYLNQVWECWTIEDVIREPLVRPVEIPQEDFAAMDAWVRSWKVQGKTAIPAGRYLISITPSVRFKRRLPLLARVPGFDAIRIHGGNKETDTEGCLIVGRIRLPDRVASSQDALGVLMSKLDPGTHTITIENPA